MKIKLLIKVAVGVLFLIFFIIILGVLFIPASRNKKDVTIVADSDISSSSIAAGSPAFMATLASVTNTAIGHGENINVITTGDQFMQILLSEIANASSSIDFTDYVWSKGTFSDDVADALIAAAHRGVRVRLLLDAVGGHTMPQSLINALDAAGGSVEKYHTFSILHPLQFDDRDHIRSIVIDNKEGFFGGMGIGDNWIENPPGTSNMAEWKDVMFEVHGTMVDSLESAFVELWNETTGEILTAASPTVASSQTVLSSQTANQPSSENGAAGSIPFINIVSIPSGNLEPVRDAFLLTIASAQKSLDIVSPFIIPDRGILDALEARARAGVDVEIVSPGDKTYAPYLRSAWQADYGELLKAGVKLYEYEPAMIHEKYIIADGVWSVTGSANMDSRSESLNAENIMGVSDPAFAGQLHQIFLGDVSQSKEITLADWSHRNIFQKMWSGFLLLFSKQL